MHSQCGGESPIFRALGLNDPWRHACRTKKSESSIDSKKAKGFGFISRERGADVFVHFRFVSGRDFKTLQEGRNANFEGMQGDKGLYV